jgi:hypothetical protein
MKKYLLTVFGNFQSEQCEEIAHCLEPLVDSTHLKFQYRSGVIIFHFESEIQMEDIHEFVELTSYPMYDSFILTEYNDNVSVFMTDDMKEHLFDLETETEGAITFDFETRNDFDISYEEEDDDDDIVTALMNQVKKNLQIPTLDQLLDKVVDNGVESLTPYEKATLDNYSQK